MKRSLFAIVLFAFVVSCNPDVIKPNKPDKYNHLLGNTLFRWKLVKYKGPDSNWKWLFSDSIPALKDDGIVFKALPDFAGYPQHPYNYEGSIYQGPLKYWPGKADLTFPVTYISDSTFKLGSDQTGYNIAIYNGEGETLTIKEISPTEGREYWYAKTSD